jgi:hypothetical protein
VSHGKNFQPGVQSTYLFKSLALSTYSWMYSSAIENMTYKQMNYINKQLSMKLCCKGEDDLTEYNNIASRFAHIL